MSERLRWKIARLLDRSRRTCWADLVTWALGWDTRLRDCGVTGACRSDLERNGACYCGKLRAPVAVPEPSEGEK